MGVGFGLTGKILPVVMDPREGCIQPGAFPFCTPCSDSILISQKALEKNVLVTAISNTLFLWQFHFSKLVI